MDRRSYKTKLSLISFTMSILILIIILLSVQFRSSLFETQSTATVDLTANAEFFQTSTGKFVDLLDANGNCELPCFWGLQVGITTNSEFLNFLEIQNLDLSSYDDNTNNAGAFLLGVVGTPDLTQNSSIAYLFTENILSRLAITLGQPDRWMKTVERYNLGSVLALFEDTPQIYIWGLGNRSDYQIVFFDNEMGVMFRYSFDLSEIQAPFGTPDTDRQFCLSLEYTNRIEMTVQDNSVFHDSVGISVENTISDYYTTDEAFNIGIDNEEFVQFFIENPNECLVISEIQGENE